jgi:hypothetical protein
MFTMPCRAGALTATLKMLAGALGGCSATADLSYGQYQFGPGYHTERFYESRVYGDTGQGFGSEACRGFIRRDVDAIGDEVVREDHLCDPGYPGYNVEP